VQGQYHLFGMSVQFLMTGQCRQAMACYIALMKSLPASVRVEVVDLYELPRDDPRRGFDSPTILVDGRDLFGESPRTDLSVPPGSRDYRDGSLTVPSIRMAISRRLDAGRPPPLKESAPLAANGRKTGL